MRRLVGVNTPVAVQDFDVEVLRSQRAFFVVDKIQLKLEIAIAIVIRQAGMDEKIPHARRRAGVQADVALDAAQRPEILVFEVAAGAPAIDFHRDRVVARLHEIA